MRFVGILYAAAYVLMVLTMFILPFFSFEGYSISRNSLNELGAQDTPGNWIMNSVFILLSLATVLLATKVLKRYWLPLYLIYFFALSLFFTAIYQHAPIEEVFFWESEHLTHSIFSMITGFVFSVYCIVIAIHLKKPVERASAIVMFCVAIGLSLLMFNNYEYRGIFQRILFITSFGWLFYSLVSFNFERNLKIS